MLRSWHTGRRVTIFSPNSWQESKISRFPKMSNYFFQKWGFNTRFDTFDTFPFPFSPPPPPKRPVFSSFLNTGTTGALSKSSTWSNNSPTHSQLPRFLLVSPPPADAAPLSHTSVRSFTTLNSSLIPYPSLYISRPSSLHPSPPPSSLHAYKPCLLHRLDSPPSISWDKLF